VTLAPALYFQEAAAGAEDSYIWVSFYYFLMKMGNLRIIDLNGKRQVQPCNGTNDCMEMK